MDRAEEHTIDANESGGLIEFILILGAHRNFDNDRKRLRNAIAQIHIMPRMHISSFKASLSPRVAREHLEQALRASTDWAPAIAATLAFIDKGLRRCTAGFVAAIDPIVPSLLHVLCQAQSATTHAPYVVCHRRVNSWRTLLRSSPPQDCCEEVTTPRRHKDDRSSRATFHRMTWWSVSAAHRKPPEVRICRLSIQSGVGTRPPSTSPHTARHAGLDVDRAPGCTGGRAP